MNYSLEMVLAATLLVIGATNSMLLIRDSVNTEVNEVVTQFKQTIHHIKTPLIINQDNQIQEATNINESYNSGK